MNFRIHGSLLIACFFFVSPVTLFAETGQPFNRLEPYNVVWESPGKDAFDSMPLGNGDISLNVWTEKNGDLLFYIGKTDSWGDNSRLLKVGKIRIRLIPNPLEQTQVFKQALNLREATIAVHYGKAEAGATLTIWADANHPVIDITCESQTPVVLTATVEPWRKEPVELPSLEVSDVHLDRSQPGQKHAPTIVEPDVIISDQAACMGWYHHNKKSIGPELTMRVQGLSGFKMTDPILHRTFGGMITGPGLKRINGEAVATPSGRSHRVSVYVLTKHPSTAGEWRAAMDHLMESTERVPFDRRFQDHRQWWSDFWDRSWIYATQNQAVQRSPIPSNAHPVRIGVDQNGRNRFLGTLGRVSIFREPLSKEQIASSFMAGREEPVPIANGLLCSEPFSAPGKVERSEAWDFKKGMTLEAWVKPDNLPEGGGRIVDKITPGASDGFLLDTHPGNSLRFIAGDQILSKKDILPVGVWSHVAAVVGGGGMILYLNGRVIGQEEIDAQPDAFVVTRGYILQRFINACAGRGAYPIKFNGSIFTVPDPGSPGDADYRRWGPGYWWQNTRLPYFSMCTSGDFDLMRPLFTLYAGDAFELSKYRTRHYFGHKGAYYPECIYFWGAVFSESYGWTRFEDREDKLQTSGYHKWEWVCGLELVWMMLDYYEHTLDETFLRKTVLPVADEVLAFFDNHYKTNPQGKLVMNPSQALETWWDCTNPMPELAGLHAITQRLLQLPEGLSTEVQRDYWKKLQQKLPDIPLREENGIKMLAPAEKFDMKRNIENPELYAVFPFRLVTLGKPNARLGIEALNHRWDKGNFGWRQDDVFMAYLGLKDQAREYLVGRARNKHKGSRFPAFWGPNYDWIPDQDHGGILLKAFQSMLIQTDGRRIDLLPSWPDDWDADFKVHAPYKTTIEGQIRGGKIEQIKVTPESRLKDIPFFQSPKKKNG